MKKKNDNDVVYLLEQLPFSLKPLALRKKFIYEMDLKRQLRPMAIQLYALELMREQASKLTALDGYRIGIVRCYGSLSAITTEYLQGADIGTNKLYIREMHYAALPFIPEILTKTDDVALMAEQLQAANEFAFNSLVNKIKI